MSLAEVSQRLTTMTRAYERQARRLAYAEKRAQDMQKALDDATKLIAHYRKENARLKRIKGISE